MILKSLHFAKNLKEMYIAELQNKRGKTNENCSSGLNLVEYFQRSLLFFPIETSIENTIVFECLIFVEF